MKTEYEEVKAILIKHDVTELEQIEYASEVFEDLYGYYMDSGEMPYDVAKARADVMPDEWIYDKLCELGFDKEEQNDPNGLPLNFTDKYHEEEPA